MTAAGAPSLRRRRYRQDPTHRITAKPPTRVFAAGSRGDQEGRCQQDRCRQRRGNQYNRFHRYPIAMPITARCRPKEKSQMAREK
jgi:hypothetical protein